MILEILGALSKSLLFVLATILPILNPAASAPMFLGLTEGARSTTRALLAKQISLNVFWMMLGCMLTGVYILKFFGISLPIVRIGGGSIVAATGWRMLATTKSDDGTMSESDRATSSESHLPESFTLEKAKHQAFYPLTFPMCCGPGSVTAAITVGASLVDAKISLTLANTMGAIMALISIGLLLYFALRYANHLLTLLGETGSIIFLRLSAFILLCLGVQIVWEGVQELVIDTLNKSLK